MCLCLALGLVGNLPAAVDYGAEEVISNASAVVGHSQYDLDRLDLGLFPLAPHALVVACSGSAFPSVYIAPFEYVLPWLSSLLRSEFVIFSTVDHIVQRSDQPFPESTQASWLRAAPEVRPGGCSVH